jgi:hypothetical protein
MWLIFKTAANRTVVAEFTGDETVRQAGEIFLKDSGLSSGLDSFTFSIGTQPLNLATQIAEFQSMTVINVSKKDDAVAAHSQSSRRSQELAGRQTAGRSAKLGA